MNSSLSLSSSVCHRLMSRLPSQLLLLVASPNPTFSKKGCLRASARGSRLEGSYSSMLSMRSNSWWCSSASDNKYRWWGNGWGERWGKMEKLLIWTAQDYHSHYCVQSFLPVKVCSSPWRISLLRSCRPSPDGHGRNTSASFKGIKSQSHHIWPT